MATFAKVLVMLVRLIGLVEIILGILLASAHLQFLELHIGLGFVLAFCVLILALLAISRRHVGIGIAGILFAIALPITGLEQFPLKFGMQLGLIQILHVVVALAAIGVAEALNGAIRKTA